MPESIDTQPEIADAEALDGVLQQMNERGDEPVVIGFDHHGFPFLAYAYSPDGELVACGFVSDDTHSSEFDYSDGTRRCEECGAFDRRDLSKLSFPVRIIAREVDHV